MNKKRVTWFLLSSVTIVGVATILPAVVIPIRNKKDHEEHPKLVLKLQNEIDAIKKQSKIISQLQNQNFYEILLASINKQIEDATKFVNNDAQKTKFLNKHIKAKIMEVEQNKANNNSKLENIKDTLKKMNDLLTKITDKTLIVNPESNNKPVKDWTEQDLMLTDEVKVPNKTLIIFKLDEFSKEMNNQRNVSVTIKLKDNKVDYLEKLEVSKNIVLKVKQNSK